MSSIHDRNDTIPMTSRRIGSWQVSISRIPLPPGQLANPYDAIATEWKRTSQRYELETAWRQPLFASGAPAALARISGEAQVLDCGIGSGSLSLALHHTLPICINWHGVDTSSEMPGPVGGLGQYSILGQTASLVCLHSLISLDSNLL